MKFGRVPVDDAAGCVLAHSLKLPSGRIAKGTVLTPAHVDAMRAADIDGVVVARLEPGETGEDAAAGRVADALTGAHLLARAPATGRCNIHAQAAGLLVYAPSDLDAVNLVDESVTVAVLPPFAVLEPGQLVATVKIIPYGVRASVVDRIVEIAATRKFRLQARPFRPRLAGLIQTFHGEAGAHAGDKTRRVTAARLALLGSRMGAELHCPHHEDAIAAAIDGVVRDGCDLVLIAGASATTDRGDVVPQGIMRAGGSVLHLGMPVEPGNLLVFGATRTGIPVICLPGCARSPALNGFDWVLERLLAGIEIQPADIMRMGAGGLIKGAPSRLPRAAPRDPEAAAAASAEPDETGINY